MRDSLKLLKNQAFAMYRKGDYQTATQLTERAVAIAQGHYGPRSLETAEFIGNLSALHRLTGDEAKADELRKNATEIRREHGQTGVPIGIQTEAFFESVMRARRERFDQARPAEIRRKLVGTWAGIQYWDGGGGGSIEEDTIRLREDGSLIIVHEHSASQEEHDGSNTEENWRIISTGTWCVKGDTVMLHIAHEQCPGRIYRSQKTYESPWEERKTAPYDSAFTDGRKNRFITLQSLCREFKYVSEDSTNEQPLLMKDGNSDSK